MGEFRWEHRAVRLSGPSLTPETFHRCGDEEEAARLQRIFDEHGRVLDHQAEI
jgi:hypothetical protein